MQRKSAFSRRLPDLVTEELVAVLSKKGASFEFKQLFDVVHDRLKKRNAASGGEEMLRLRAYEKLQHLVSRNMVKKSGKKYKGLASLAHAIAPDEPLPAAISFGAPPAVKVPASKAAPAPKKITNKDSKPAVKKSVPAVAPKKAAPKKITKPAPKPVVKKAVLKKVVSKKPAKKSSK